MGKKDYKSFIIISKCFGDKVLHPGFLKLYCAENRQLGIIEFPTAAGNSTLLKIMQGSYSRTAERWKWRNSKDPLVFSQEVREMNTSQRVIDYIKDVAEYIFLQRTG